MKRISGILKSARPEKYPQARDFALAAGLLDLPATAGLAADFATGFGLALFSRGGAAALE
jgi:hypothetical protein